uniref:lysoplasmalogenase family protein n=1 Tax=Thaumasiovibrio occultus TaxID=1891184 RepID=UPI00131D98FD|nr:lysoplasmalogenase family protein [Thaumasiovibrio occultus]
MFFWSFFAASCGSAFYFFQRQQTFAVGTRIAALVCLMGVAITSSFLSTGWLVVWIAALLFSVLGELALWRDDLKRTLFCFSGSYLCGAAVFYSLLSEAVLGWVPALYYAGAILLLLLLLPNVQRMLPAVIVYLASGASMGWLAAERWFIAPDLQGAMAFGGSLLLIFAGVFAGAARVRPQWRFTRWTYLACYLTAHALLNLSVVHL